MFEILMELFFNLNFRNKLLISKELLFKLSNLDKSICYEVMFSNIFNVRTTYEATSLIYVLKGKDSVV